MSTTTDNRREADVEFTHEDDTGLVTTRDVETGVASCGETKAEALAMLAEAPRWNGAVTNWRRTLQR